MPRVSIIFPNYNGKNDTLACLISLTKLNYPENKIEIIMVDNASVDDSIKAVEKDFPSAKVISLKKNFGFAKAVNQGIYAARGDYIFVINNDIIFDKDFLTVLVDFMENHTEVGIAGGKIYYQNPKDKQSLFSGENKILFSGLRFNPWLGSIHQLPYPNQIKESEWIQGCAMLIKRGVIEKVGLFDENFFFSFEDLDFCQRAKKAGFKIIYYPKAVAWHKDGATINQQGLSKKALELYKAKFYYLFKHGSIPQIIISTLSQFLLIALIRKIFVRQPPFFIRPMFSGFFYSLRHLPKVNRDQRKR